MYMTKGGVPAARGAISWGRAGKASSSPSPGTSTDVPRQTWRAAGRRTAPHGARPGRPAAAGTRRPAGDLPDGPRRGYRGQGLGDHLRCRRPDRPRVPGRCLPVTARLQRPRALLPTRRAACHDETAVRHLDNVARAVATMDRHGGDGPTFFEVATALAFQIFAGEHVDYAVVETSLGGLLDATNTIARPDKTGVLTEIGLDHTEVLGRTLPEIAAQKAGILPHDGRAFAVHDRSPQVVDVIAAEARRRRCALHFVDTTGYVRAATAVSEGTVLRLLRLSAVRPRAARSPPGGQRGPRATCGRGAGPARPVEHRSRCDRGGAAPGAAARPLRTSPPTRPAGRARRRPQPAEDRGVGRHPAGPPSGAAHAVGPCAGRTRTSGTVTGAPKASTMALIRDLERIPRA